MMLNSNAVKACKIASAATPKYKDTVSQLGNFSLGGKVRRGAGLQYEQTDSLPYGEPVILLERTGVMMDGFEWFRIEYSEGLTGYQWGGIMCSRALHIIGIYSPCPDDVK